MQEAAVSLLTTWYTFYVLIGSAAATLTGLMFVVATLIAGARVRVSSPSEAFATFNTPNVVHFCLALLVALACLWLWRDHAAMADWEESMAAMGMKDMEMEGGPMATSSAPAAYLVEAFVMWLIMMVAMMLPSAAPMILLYGMQYIFTATPRMVDTSLGFAGVSIGAIRITWTRIIGSAIAVVAFLLLYAVLNLTQFGRAMRAIAQNREAALMVGIRPRTVARNAVVLATALCGLAGAALAPIQLVQPAMGQAVIFKAFALVIIGGLGNMPGAFVTALALGMIESWIGGFFDVIWQEAAVFALMIAVVMVKPDGLFQRGGMRVG
jgi:branched-subunit amino acid ABC-type transport system permease component